MEVMFKNSLYILTTFFTSGLAIIVCGKMFGEAISKALMSKIELKFNRELEEYKTELGNKSARDIEKYKLKLESTYNKELEAYKIELENKNSKDIESHKAELENINSRELAKLNTELNKKNYVTELRFNTEFEVYREISKYIHYEVEDIILYAGSVFKDRESVYSKIIERYSKCNSDLHRIINENRFVINDKIIKLIDNYILFEDEFAKIIMDEKSFHKGEKVLKANLKEHNESEIKVLMEIAENVDKLKLEILMEMRDVINSYAIVE